MRNAGGFGQSSDDPCPLGCVLGIKKAYNYHGFKQ